MGIAVLPHRRSDIQGLRALAVLGVLAQHIIGWPRGGFLGVDVFFVISGFVITGILLRRRQAQGRIDVGDFYRRRARRILPLALLVLAVTVGLAYLTFSPQWAHDIGVDALWAAAFAANWHFAAVGADYFAHSGPPSPLEHYWSLAVEEQFYLVWPAVVLLARRALVPVATVMLLASAAWATWSAAAQPVTAYYSTFTRVWELLLGAVLAAAPPLAAGVGLRLRRLLGYAALVAIIGAFVLVQPPVGMPLPGAAIPTLATGLLLMVGTAPRPTRDGRTGEQPGEERVGHLGAAPSSRRAIRAARSARWVGPAILTNRVSGYVGDVSYGLYLWHVPVMIFTAAAMPVDGWIGWVVVLGITGVLTVVSRVLVELPLRRGWHSVPRRTALVAAGAVVALVGSYATAAAAAPTLLTGNLGVNAAQNGLPAPPAHPPMDSATPSTAMTVKPTTSTPTATASRTPTPTATSALVVPQQATGVALERGLREALAAGQWPADLTPAPGDWHGFDAPAGFDDCQATDVADPTSCAFGTKKGPEIDVYGDSLGIPLLAATVAAYGDTHRVRGLTKLACAVNGVDANYGKPEWAIPCENHRKAVLAYVKQHRPDTLLMVQTYAWATKLNSGASGAAAAREWAAADQRTVDALRPYVNHVVIVGASMPGVAFAQCYRAGGSPSACVTGIPEWWARIRTAETTVVGATFLDTRHWYCADGRCPLFSTAGDVVLKADYL
ncbi:MAG: acyltransferase family protein, partial [Nostocoides sp.]